MSSVYENSANSAGSANLRIRTNENFNKNLNVNYLREDSDTLYNSRNNGNAYNQYADPTVNTSSSPKEARLSASLNASPFHPSRAAIATNAFTPDYDTYTHAAPSPYEKGDTASPNRFASRHCPSSGADLEGLLPKSSYESSTVATNGRGNTITTPEAGLASTYNSRYTAFEEPGSDNNNTNNNDGVRLAALPFARKNTQQPAKSPSPCRSDSEHDRNSNRNSPLSYSKAHPSALELKRGSAVSITTSIAAASAFSEAELRYFKKIFETFDADKKGSLGFGEIKALCRHLGVEIGDEELRDSIDDIDDNGNGTLEFDEFIQWLAEMGGSTSVGGDKEISPREGGREAGKGGSGRGSRRSVSAQSASSQQSQGGGHDAWAVLKSKIRAKGANPLTNKQIEKYREIFIHFDANGSGTIDREELREVFVAMGRDDVGDEELDEVMATVDDDGSGEIDFDEFLMLMSIGFSKGGGMGADGSLSMEKYIFGVFEQLDPMRTDKVSAEEFKDVLLRICGGELSEMEADLIIKGCPKDDHGRICYTQWHSLWDACQGAC